MRSRSRRIGPLLVLVFLVVPVVELAVLIQVGRVIGPWWTILLLLADSVLGAWIIKREGRRAFEALRARVEQGRLPARELADGALVVLGGALLLSPGFVTDVLGLLLVLPFTRPLFRRVAMGYAESRVTRSAARGAYAWRAGNSGAQGPDATRPGGPTVVRGEVVDEE